MLTIIQKLSIAALFIGCILLPMDPPVENSTAPISIASLCDQNIYYFTNALNAINANLQNLKIEDNLKQKTQKQKVEIQHLLKLNQTFKQQQDYLSQNRDDSINRLRENDAKKEESLSRLQDRFDTEMGKVFQGNPQLDSFIEGHHVRVDQAIDRGLEQAQEKIAQDVTKMLQESDQEIHNIFKTTGVPTTSHNSITTTEPKKISPEDHTKTHIAKQMDEIATMAENSLQALQNTYQPEIEKNKQKIEGLKKEKEILEKKHTQLNRVGYCMCAGIFALIISTIYITKYLCPQ